MCWTSYLCRYQCCILLDFLLARPLVFKPRPGTCIVSIYLRFIFLDNLLVIGIGTREVTLVAAYITVYYLTIVRGQQELQRLPNQRLVCPHSSKESTYCARRPSFMMGWGCCYSGKGSRLEKMTPRHNRFLNINAVDQILSRIEAIVRRINPGAGNELLYPNYRRLKLGLEEFVDFFPEISTWSS